MGFFAVLVTNYMPFLPRVRYWITSNLQSTNYSRVTRQRLRASCQVPNDHINSDRMLDLLLGLFCSRKFHFALGFPPFFDGTSHSAPLAIEVSSNTAHRQRVYDPHPGEVFFLLPISGSASRYAYTLRCHQIFYFKPITVSASFERPPSPNVHCW